MRRFVLAIVVVGLLALASVVPAFAHGNVTPTGTGECRNIPTNGHSHHGLITAQGTPSVVGNGPCE